MFIGGVLAEDKDEGSFGQIKYSITDGNENNLFYIETSTGIIRAGTDLAGYARDEPYMLTVRGQDGGKPPGMCTQII